MYTNNRNAYRQAFFVTWQKFQNHQPLEAIEAQLIDIINKHPDYHVILNQPGIYETQEFSLEENPFFHMSLHLGLNEQLKTNRPVGIQQVYQQLIARFDNAHRAEHEMMACLATMMGQGQQTGVIPSDEAYLLSLKEI